MDEPVKNLTINVVALCSLLLTAGVALGQDAEARIVGVVNPAQRIGIQIGDVIERKVMLDVKSPYQLSPNALPQKGLNRNGIELSAITLDATKRGELTAYTLLLRYQVFADVSTPVVLQTPAEEFALTGGPHALSIKLPEWRFWFSPLVATELRQVAANMQPQYPTTWYDNGLP